MVAACDTFRSGAIEQLGVHCRNLGVELYQRGYGKQRNDDATMVATQAIRKASEEGHDVVLVDTSGRMQGNVKLMRELANVCDFPLFCLLIILVGKCEQPRFGIICRRGFSRK